MSKKADELSRIQADIDSLNEKYVQSLSIYKKLEGEISAYENTLDLYEFGLYKPQFNFDHSEQYRLALEVNYDKQKICISNNLAIVCKTEWTVSGSVVEGRKLTRQYTKLMTYAFNGECDSLIAKVKWNNIDKTKERIIKAFENINKLGQVHNIQVTEAFLALKIEELSLTYEYELKKHEEKEEQRRIREQMKEEEKVRKEYERLQKEAEDEEARFKKAINKTQKELESASQSEVDELNKKIKDLEKSLLEAQEKKERAISLAQMTKVGHIYVISNHGSFGEDIYKIGMTRRIDPLDRVKELGDASVPFQFDVHAIIYSENAPQLEYDIHRKFASYRLNKVNNRKEFFRVSIDEIEQFVLAHTNAAIQFTKMAEAREFRQTQSLLLETNPPLAESNNYPQSLK
ncbi:MAG: chromosome partitioning protein ParA [Bacteroidetes bacterium 43-93]|nr:MAG: chromosome partitioning protein ParA [Bacteroidetes bacterium 43-93]